MLDFLGPSVVSRITSRDPTKAKPQSSTWEKFNKDGKMVIEDSEESGDDDENSGSGMEIPGIGGSILYMAEPFLV